MKMKNIIKITTAAVVLLVGAISCSKDSFDINKNPNQATDSTIVYNVILPAAENNTARLVSRNWGWLQNYLSYWARSGTYAPNTNEETYELTTTFQAQIWSGAYDNLYDYEVMRISAAKAGAGMYEGIARIMKAHNYAMLVDIYNNIPYSQSLKGAANTTPSYDKGADIYKDLLRQIDTGIALIKDADLGSSANADIATNDVMLGGDQTRWAQFGNTLKLRILTKFMNGGVAINADGSVGTPEVFAPGVDLAAEFQKIADEGSGFLDADAEVNPGYKSDKGNPFYNLYLRDNAGTATANSVYYDANEYAIGYYQYNGDKRIASFYTTSPTGYTGVAYGLPSATENADANLSGIGVGLTGPDATTSQRILTAAESHFLQAECIHRGFLSGDARTETNNGITASFESMYRIAHSTRNPLTDADEYINVINAGYSDVDYSAQEGVNGNLTAGGLYTIISQKWFALNGIAPWEVWSDYRRVDYSSVINHFVYGEVTGFDAGPAISVSPANTKTEIPVRLLYPQTEYLYNPTNVGAEGSAGSYPFNHIFWDVN